MTIDAQMFSGQIGAAAPLQRGTGLKGVAHGIGAGGGTAFLS